MHKFWNWHTLKKQVIDKSTNETKETIEQVLTINGPIAEESWFDDEITPELFKDELSKVQGDFKLYINSPGGDCVAAARIYTMLVEHKGNVTVLIDGMAASAASVIAMAGTTVKMAAPAMMMIHDPLTMTWGNANELEKTIEMLNSVKESIINAYEAKTKLKRNKIAELMSNETWMDAKKAIELGFCDEILSREEKEDMDGAMNSVFFQKKLAENNLTNKLNEKYLIKKQPVAEPQENEPEGVPANLLMARLEGMKNVM